MTNLGSKRTMWKAFQGWQMSHDYIEISWVHLGGKQSLIEVYNSLWRLVDYSVAKMVWEQIGEKLECQAKEFGFNKQWTFIGGF